MRYFEKSKCLLEMKGLLGDNSFLNRLNANPTKWSNTLRRFVGKFPANCLSVFDHFVGLALKGLRRFIQSTVEEMINCYDDS